MTIKSCKFQLSKCQTVGCRLITFLAYLKCDHIAVFSLGCLCGCCTPYCATIPPISVSEAAAPPIKMMACKVNLYPIIITKQLLTSKYTAIDCAILTLTEDRNWIQDYSAPPLCQNSGKNTATMHIDRRNTSLISPSTSRHPSMQ